MIWICSFFPLRSAVMITDSNICSFKGFGYYCLLERDPNFQNWFLDLWGVRICQLLCHRNYAWLLMQQPPRGSWEPRRRENLIYSITLSVFVKRHHIQYSLEMKIQKNASGVMNDKRQHENLKNKRIIFKSTLPHSSLDASLLSQFA